MISLSEQLILERNIEDLDMDLIVDQLCSDGFDSRIIAGADDLWVGEVIFFSSQDLKSHLVRTNRERVDFGGFIRLRNILTFIQQWLKDEDTL